MKREFIAAYALLIQIIVVIILLFIINFDVHWRYVTVGVVGIIFQFLLIGLAESQLESYNKRVETKKDTIFTFLVWLVPFGMGFLIWAMVKVLMDGINQFKNLK